MMTKYKPCDLPSVKLQDKKKKKEKECKVIYFSVKDIHSPVSSNRMKLVEIQNYSLNLLSLATLYTPLQTAAVGWMGATPTYCSCCLFSPSQALGCMLTLVLAQAQMAVERRSVWINAIMWPSIRRGLHVEKQVITLLVMKLLI